MCNSRPATSAWHARPRKHSQPPRRIGSRDGIGLGNALGQYLDHLNCTYPDASLVLAAHRAGIPCTVHVALGTDIVHMHPQVSGADLGEASLLDFRILCTVVSMLGGGVWMNLGSAVVMPEVFLKAVSVARNFGCDLDGLVTVNFDKESKYRTGMNVLAASGVRRHRSHRPPRAPDSAVARCGDRGTAAQCANVDGTWMQSSLGEAA